MEGLVKLIEGNINKSITNFIEKISENYQIDREELVKLWEELGNNKIKSRRNSVVSTKKGCNYIFTKGNNQGNECGVKCSGQNSYCKKHMETSKGKKQIIIRKHPKIGEFFHPPTKLVFKSNKERIIIGKIFNGNVCSLTDEDIKTCKSWKFRFKEVKQEEEVKE